MRTLFRISIVSMLLTVAGLSAGASAAAAAAAKTGGKVVKRPITFQVRNVNRSVLSCPSDGAAYEVKGHLVGRASDLGSGAASGSRSVTVYLHGFSFGESFWSFGAVPRYDYAAAMARAGHVSVVVDRLGYGASGRPEGTGSCLGAQADVAHQIVADMRSGDYTAEAGKPLRFDRVALAGHSMGALIANLEAISFGDADALVAMSYTPQVTQQTFEQFYANREVCEAGGRPARPGGPGGYATFGQTVAEFDARVFYSADPAVRAVADKEWSADPCGDSGSIIDGLVQDLKLLARVRVPVLLVCGTEDAAIPSFACPVLKGRYTGSSDVSLFFIARAGHALTLERPAPTFRRRVAAWLHAHGF